MLNLSIKAVQSYQSNYTHQIKPSSIVYFIGDLAYQTICNTYIPGIEHIQVTKPCEHNPMYMINKVQGKSCCNVHVKTLHACCYDVC